MSDTAEIQRQRFQSRTAEEAVATMLQQAKAMRERARTAHPDDDQRQRVCIGRAKVLEGTAEVIAAQNDLPAPEVSP